MQKFNYKKTSRELLAWYRANARKLPWRETRKPYPVWVSEIILQQTTVDQGLPYYYRFLERFPTLESLSNATLDEVLVLWQGLGYYSRARNMHATAQYIQNKLEGKFPDNHTGLLRLKGVGPYTAAAIASFCFDEKVVVVDGNVIRFIARLLGHAGDMASKKNIDLVRQDAQLLIQPAPPAEFNQAIMEFGALVCTAKNPLCASCIFMDTCRAYATSRVSDIPFKSKKTKKKERFFNYAVLLDPSNHTFLQRRTGKDIWQGLYEFPLLELNKNISGFPDVEDFGLDIPALPVLASKTYRHILSHQVLHARFILYKTNEPLGSDRPRLIKAHIHELSAYALPRLINLYLDDLSITLL